MNTRAHTKAGLAAHEASAPSLASLEHHRVVGASVAVVIEPMRPDRQSSADLKPRVQLPPSPAGHSDLAGLPPFPRLIRMSPGLAVEIGLGDVERLADL